MHLQSESIEPQLASASRATNALLWILVLGAIARVGVWYLWASWSPLMNDDAHDYQRLATRLVVTGRYENERGRLISLRPPLYPAFVAASYRAFGVQNNGPVRALQAGIGLLITVLVYRLGALTYSNRVGLWAAGFTCFYPSLLGYENLLLSETLFTFFVVAVTFLVCEALNRQALAILLVAGIAMGFGALARSIMLLFSPLLSMFLLLNWRGSWHQRAMAALLPLVAFAAVITPWAVRNTRIQNTLTVIDVMGGRNAMMGNYEYTPLERSWATISDVLPERQWHRVLLRDRPSDAVPNTQGQLDKLALRHAIGFVLDHPWLTVKRDVVKFFNFWQLEREFIAAARAGFFGDMSIAAQLALAAIICLSYAAVICLAIFGACCVPPSNRRLHALLLLSILFPCAIHSLIFAHSRYHLPIIPLLAVYAAATVVHRKALWQSTGTWRFKLAVALCSVLVLGWTRELVIADLQLLQGAIS
jgi:4-amino-4-deoxy-L-arabinose transferase-like glycosyltransferase